MTEMMFPLPPLQSTAVVADGQWHEVTAERDGTYRRLWADNQEVAKDALPMTLPPVPWNGTLTFGAGANLEPDSFFSDLIDDVRIYNRAVRP
ncbi:MAG: LamG domain-containing protein [Phycisphaerales bacterium]|nr:MAG: LamG domain-containing protein [Phycisphaerales bacterium]